MKNEMLVAISLLCILLLAGSVSGAEIIIENSTIVTVVPADDLVLAGNPFSGLLPVPILISPANGTTFSHVPRTMVLAWRPVTGADSYRVELACRPGLAWVPFATETVSGENTTFYQFESPGDYPGRWRVTALGSWNGLAIESRPSLWWNFAWNTRQTLATPVQVSPGGGAVFSHYPRVTTLAWNPVPGATGYLLERDILSGSEWIAYPDVTVTGEPNSSYTFVFDTSAPCRWRVTAIDFPAFGNSTASPWWQFSFVS